MNEFISGNIKPWRVGVYERMFNKRLCEYRYTYFDGQTWYFSCHDKEYAVEEYKDNRLSSYQSLPWRGLTKAEYDRETKLLKS